MRGEVGDSKTQTAILKTARIVGVWKYAPGWKRPSGAFLILKSLQLRYRFWGLMGCRLCAEHVRFDYSFYCLYCCFIVYVFIQDVRCDFLIVFSVDFILNKSVQYCRNIDSVLRWRTYVFSVSGHPWRSLQVLWNLRWKEQSFEVCIWHIFFFHSELPM